LKGFFIYYNSIFLIILKYIYIYDFLLALFVLITSTGNARGSQNLIPLDSLKIKFSESTSDTLRLSLAFDIAYLYYREGDSIAFREWNKKTFQLARKGSNLVKEAEAHWDLGNFFFKNSITDSSYYHYYKAHQLYLLGEDKFYAGRMLLNMGIVRENVKDYIGSETTTIRAIEYLEPFHKKEQLYIGYSNLGVVMNALEDFEESIKYHNKALGFALELSDEFLVAKTYNNLGVVYRNQHRYKKAIESFKKALYPTNLRMEDPKLYAMILDNLAYTNFKSGSAENYFEVSQRALEIREDVNHISGIIINNLHIGEYFLVAGNIEMATTYFLKAKELSQNFNNYRYLLESLLFLSKSDPINLEKYLERYIILNEKLMKEERLIRNKFARIRFETDEYIQKAAALDQQRIFIIVVSIISGIVFFLLYFLKDQKSKNKELIFEQEKELADARIYELFFLQQEKLEEVRNNEKNRIASELHDGALGTLFGLRMNFGILKIELQDCFPPSILRQFNINLDSLQRVEKEIRTFSHELNSEAPQFQLSFSEILENLINEKDSLTDISILLKGNRDSIWILISNEIKINIFRIVQESIQNCIKHSQASTLEIYINLKNQKLLLEIEDNGVGFIKGRKGKGIGLKSIHRRVDSLGGSFEMNSEKGFKLSIVIPI